MIIASLSVITNKINQLFQYLTIYFLLVRTLLHTHDAMGKEDNRDGGTYARKDRINCAGKH